MSGGEMSGVDLARVALRAAMEAARKNGNGQKKSKRKPRPVPTVRRDGREPVGLGATIGALVTERAWELPATGATLRQRWAAIAPELAGHVAAVSYDPDSGQLTVRPETSAWATQARLEQSRVIAAANTAAGRTVVRTLRILPPGPLPAPGPADVVPAVPFDTPTSPVRKRATGCEGYRRALAEHRTAWNTARQPDPEIQKAFERQIREQAREPDHVFADGRQAAVEKLRAKATAQQRSRSSDAARARALQRLAVERAGLATITPAAVPGHLGRTA